MTSFRTSLDPTDRPSAEMRDEELWMRFVETDSKSSFEILHARYREPLHAFIRRCGVRDDARVADLCQEVWVRLINNRERFDPTKRWGTWAFHIAKNLARNEGRRLKRQIVSTEADYRMKDEEIRPAASAFLPEVMMRERALDTRLATIVADLPTEQRTIFRLRFIEGHSNEEVSTSLGIPLSAMKAKAKRVRLKVLMAMQDLLDRT